MAKTERTADGSTVPFLGTGWGFPPTFTFGGAELVTTTGVEDIHQSLQILLATRLGERAMSEDYGCNLDEIVFEEVDQRLINRVTAMVNDAILYHEPRIELLDLQVSQDAKQAELLLIRLSYRVPETNSRFNMVYPFFLTEATEVQF
ncbi:GPW/gp25 [Plesiocystis pacifica SIR-1]|uniref:GPW/gp25 n=1 Tax=Plesiocystis pacifica SIR-1 TaxID=391625 RepID=A6FZ69_9BACT|nr:GPW/gp25 family protein [Plesiocystis pacifica]EDM80953.1 GPW/gp25 [Plesiocystis pacifica SIR-1]